MKRRRLSDEQVDELIDLEIARRHTARLADPRWTLEPDEFTASIGGGIWREKQGEE